MRHGRVDAVRLRAIVERVGRVHAARAALGEDLKAIWGEARGGGFDVRALKEAVRRHTRDGRQAFEAVVAGYLAAIEAAGVGAGVEPEKNETETGTVPATRAGAREAARAEPEAVALPPREAGEPQGLAMPPIPEFLRRGNA
jgi:uncharacterized protein (UPF0335 family)